MLVLGERDILRAAATRFIGRPQVSWSEARVLLEEIQMVLPHVVLCLGGYGDAIHDWCTEQYGKPAFRVFQIGRRATIDVREDSRWAVSGTQFYFLRPEDAFQFKIRWV